MANPTFRVSSGLPEKAHRKRMGDAVWLFMWLVNKQTKPDGTVLGGRPIKCFEIGAGLGYHRVTVLRHIRTLEAGYIAVKRTPYGLVIRILHQKKFPQPVQKASNLRKRDVTDVLHRCNRSATSTCRSATSKIKTPEVDPEVDPEVNPPRRGGPKNSGDKRTQGAANAVNGNLGPEKARRARARYRRLEKEAAWGKERDVGRH